MRPLGEGQRLHAPPLFSMSLQFRFKLVSCCAADRIGWQGGHGEWQVHRGRLRTVDAVKGDGNERERAHVRLAFQRGRRGKRLARGWRRWGTNRSGRLDGDPSVSARSSCTKDAARRRHPWHRAFRSLLANLLVRVRRPWVTGSARASSIWRSYSPSRVGSSSSGSRVSMDKGRGARRPLHGGRHRRRLPQRHGRGLALCDLGRGDRARASCARSSRGLLASRRCPDPNAARDCTDSLPAFSWLHTERRDRRGRGTSASISRSSC